MILTVLVNGLWQGALVVAVTAAALKLLSPRSAATRYAAWFCALVAMFAMPVLTATSHWGAALLAAMEHHARSNAGILSLVPIRAVSSVASGPLQLIGALYSSHALSTIAALWLVGAAAGLLRLAVSLHRIAKIRRTATPFSQADGVPVLVSNGLTIPIAAGIFLPVIVLPSELAQNLTTDQLACTIEHELAHVRRGDILTNLVQRVVEALLFWNPWAYVAGANLVRERECACDDRAASRIGKTVDYASCLAALGRLITAAPRPVLTPSAFVSRNALVNRIERLTAESSRNDLSLNYFALAAITMLFVVMTLALQALVPAPVNAALIDPRMGSMGGPGYSTASGPCADRKSVV